MMPHLFHMDGLIIILEMHHVKMSLNALVIVIPKQELVHVATPILLLV